MRNQDALGRVNLRHPVIIEGLYIVRGEPAEARISGSAAILQGSLAGFFLSLKFPPAFPGFPARGETSYP
jgi:hypothetical protein